MYVEVAELRADPEITVRNRNTFRMDAPTRLRTRTKAISVAVLEVQPPNTKRDISAEVILAFTISGGMYSCLPCNSIAQVNKTHGIYISIFGIDKGMIGLADYAEDQSFYLF